MGRASTFACASLFAAAIIGCSSDDSGAGSSGGTSGQGGSAGAAGSGNVTASGGGGGEIAFDHLAFVRPSENQVYVQSGSPAQRGFVGQHLLCKTHILKWATPPTR
jgi:hypothetical protein